MLQDRTFCGIYNYPSIAKCASCTYCIWSKGKPQLFTKAAAAAIHHRVQTHTQQGVKSGFAIIIVCQSTQDIIISQSTQILIIFQSTQITAICQTLQTSAPNTILFFVIAMKGHKRGPERSDSELSGLICGGRPDYIILVHPILILSWVRIELTSDKRA